MEIRSIFLVMIFMGLPAICLIYAWYTWSRTKGPISQNGWRERLLPLGLPLATLSLLLISGFLVRGYRWDEQSFSGPPPIHWAILNWIGFSAWIYVCFAAMVGKGKLRIPLSLWCFAMPLLKIACMLMGFYY
jgi:hypothetical protein